MASTDHNVDIKNRSPGDPIGVELQGATSHTLTVIGGNESSPRVKLGSLEASIKGTDVPIKLGPLSASVGGAETPIKLAPLEVEIAHIRFLPDLSIDVSLFGIRVFRIKITGSARVVPGQG